MEFLKKSVEIPSISGNETEFSQFLLNSMKKMGFHVKQDELGNVIGKIGNGSPVLLLCSHMDTVVGTIPVKLEKGNLYGRGAIDAKGSLISMICAVARFIGKPLSGTIIVAGIVEEETTLRGINSLLDSMDHVDYAIFGEPSGVNRICIASKGRIHLHLTFKMKRGTLHVSSSELNQNAIHIAIDFWDELKKRLAQKPFQGKTPFFSVEPNITVIKGGTATNVLPDVCEVDIDLRFPPGIGSHQILEEIEKLKADKDIEIKVLSQIEGFRADKETKLVESLKIAIEEVTGSEAKFLRKGGTNFMTIISNRLQIPCISYGPGDPTLEHTATEHIDVAEYQQVIEVLEKFISLITLHLR
ncbi:MAG TPA: M20/M25/M40 family metallo-hydrolase [Candidatus Deferrimicrobium sp.]|nr:M20/M25/M40 family metallo-hydrolase [Candidatus Deferrimicrobium sp.]